jgi:hypothetical protein
MTVLYNPASAQLHPTCNKLASGGLQQSSLVAAFYYDSADWSQILAMPPLVEIHHPLHPVALSPERFLPDVIQSVLTSRALPKAVQSRSPHLRKLLKRPHGTAKNRSERGKSAPEWSGPREPSSSPKSDIRHPTSNLASPTSEIQNPFGSLS